MSDTGGNRFDAALERGGPLILDGGLATELEAQGHDIGTRLWSAELLRSNPRAIVDAHLAFLEAGAECIISASYQASRQGFAELGLSEADADRLIAGSVDLALEARDEFMADHPETGFEPLVAASVGPYGAVRHDGSEYRGHYGVTSDTLRLFHAARLRLLDASGADVLACETIPDRFEAAVLADLLQDCHTPAWLSFSCSDDAHISDGTPIEEVAGTLAEHPVIRAVGVNCTAPALVMGLIAHLRAEAPHKAIVVYPNSGESYDADANRWQGVASAVNFADAARDWREAGAMLIGGCCRIGPRHIAAIRDALRG